MRGLAGNCDHFVIELVMEVLMSHSSCVPILVTLLAACSLRIRRPMPGSLVLAGGCRLPDDSLRLHIRALRVSFMHVMNGFLRHLQMLGVDSEIVAGYVLHILLLLMTLLHLLTLIIISGC